MLTIAPIKTDLYSNFHDRFRYVKHILYTEKSYLILKCKVKLLIIKGSVK